MKKQLLLLCVMLGLSLSSNAIIHITITATSGPPRTIQCTVSEPYWPQGANWVCCCDINCSVNGSYSGGITHCVFWQAFVTTPPPTAPTYYEVNAETSLAGTGPFTQQQQDDYYNFKNNGSYTYAHDVIHTDQAGNRITIKAGTYYLKNGKVSVMASSTPL